MKKSFLFAAVAAALAFVSVAQGVEHKVKVLAVAEDPTTFARDMKSKALWATPTTARFHFKLAGGKLIEVTEPAEETPVKK